MKILTLTMLVCCALLAQQQDDLDVLHVQGNVYVIAGDGGNIVVQTGDLGVLVVDSGSGQKTDKVIAAIRKLSDKPIQYLLNTGLDSDHTGGNIAIKKAGVTITGANVTGDISDAAAGAAILAHQNVLNRVSAPSGKKASLPEAAWPTATFLSGQKEVFFNEEPVALVHQPNAHTDGDSIVVFRRSDVVATGDVFLTTSFPNIDLQNGGSIQGELDALNNILDIAIPKHDEEGGTYIVPGHGRICDEYDLLEYRDMLTIIRDRVQAAMKKGMTLDQILQAKYTIDYDARFSAKSGFGTSQNFLTSVYKSLSSATTARK
jgi:cyclase